MAGKKNWLHIHALARVSREWRAFLLSGYWGSTALPSLRFCGPPDSRVRFCGPPDMYACLQPPTPFCTCRRIVCTVPTAAPLAGVAESCRRRRRLVVCPPFFLGRHHWEKLVEYVSDSWAKDAVVLQAEAAQGGDDDVVMVRVR